MCGMVLWVPMLAEDDLLAAKRQAALWHDDRVHHWWTGSRDTALPFQRSLGLHGPAWDVYLLYPPGVRWEEHDPPAPAFWMHQLFDPGADKDRLLCRDPSRLAAELDLLLKE